MSYLVTKSETIYDSEIIIAPRRSVCEGHISVGSSTDQGFVYGTLIYPLPVPRIYANISGIIHRARAKSQSWSRNVMPSMQPEYSFLGAFEKSRIATISCDMSVLSVCLPACMEKLGYHWTDFR
jgi:hypothetical protein